LIVAAVRKWLDENRDWLLIFDNAPTPEVVRPFLPRQFTGHVLITSRNPNSLRYKTKLTALCSARLAQPCCCVFEGDDCRH
jgi:hypothetical protein